jgi:hypothetical protein
MTPDIEQHLELLAGILAAILVILHRLKKRNGRVRLVLTVEDTEQPSSESPPNTRTKEADGRRTDSSEPRKQPTRRPGSDE